MIDDDDDLFAVRPAPVKAPEAPAKRDAPIHHSAPTIHVSGPVASLACRCGAREEVKEPCPAALDCYHCDGLETMRRYVPRYPPPPGGGRNLTPLERRGLELDGR